MPSRRLSKAQTDYSNFSFNVENSYDYDGNLKTLKRYGSKGNVLDNFNYEYIAGTNKLRKVSGTSDQFTYDYNGNMMGDGLQDNYGLKYDHRNLLTEISRLISENETELTRYYYDEAGNRIRKLILRNWSGGGGIPDPPVWGDIGNLPIYQPEGEGGDGWSIYKNEYYVRGVGGNTIAEYDWETLQQWNVYGTDNVGKITKEEVLEKNYYYLKDHLGSIRAVIDEYNNCVSAQDYDMWGYLLENRTYNIDEAKYKFTGKERDAESSYDYFGARYYMSRIGRWGGVDPLFEKYPCTSPYVYAANNPMLYVDINGRDVYIHGEDSEIAFEELDDETDLDLKFDRETGKLSVSGDPETPMEELLKSAILNNEIVVNLYTTDKNTITVDGKSIDMVVGLFLGSKIDEDGKVHTTQYFNFSHAEKWEEAGGSNVGLSVLHEINESFIGAALFGGEVSYGRGRSYDWSHFLTVVAEGGEQYYPGIGHDPARNTIYLISEEGSHIFLYTY